DGFWPAFERDDAAAAARALSSLLPAADEAVLIRQEIAAAAEESGGPHALPAIAAAHGIAGAVASWDAESYLPDDLLVKVDLASMAHALENRSPFLDHDLWEHVATLPPSRRFHWRVTKPLLRRYAAGRIPDAARRAPKRGFQLPLEPWLRGAL